EIHVDGRQLRSVFVAIDVGVRELLLAQNLNCDGVIAHHPAGGKAQLEGYKVTVKILSQQEFADSHIDSNQDPSEVAPFDVNLTVGGNIVELSEFESGLHYLLGIKQGVSCLLDWLLEY